LDKYLEKKKISTKPSVSRWGITQIVFCFALFFIATAIALIALWLSLLNMNMDAGWVAFGFAMFCLGVGIFAICYMFHVAGRWLKDQEPSSEYIILKAIAKKLGVSDDELKEGNKKETKETTTTNQEKV
jgi:amino acid transporter